MLIVLLWIAFGLLVILSWIPEVMYLVPLMVALLAWTFYKDHRDLNRQVNIDFTKQALFRYPELPDARSMHDAELRGTEFEYGPGEQEPF